MATRDLRFNIFANDRASAAFARASAAAEALANRITRLDGKRARIRVDADTSEVEAKIARAEAQLAALNKRKASPTIDADIKLFEALIVKANEDLARLSRKEATPAVNVAIAKAQADILKFQEKIEALNREKASPEVDAKIAQAQARLDELREELDYLEKNGAEIDVRADTRNLEAKVEKAKEELAELQRFRPSVEIDAEVAQANQKIRDLEENLAGLARARVSPTVDADIERAEQNIDRLERQLVALGQQTPTPLVRLHTTQVEAQLAALRGQLRDLETQRNIRVSIQDIQGEIAALKARIVELNGMRATPKIEADTAAAMTKLALLEARLAAMRDRTVRIRLDERFGQGANSLLGYLNNLRVAFQNNINGAAQLMRNVRQLFLPISTAGLLPTLASLGASFREMIGVIGLIPATVSFAAAAIGTLSIAFNGLTDAIGPRDTGAQIKKADLAMSRLGENAQAVARAVIDLKDEWNNLKNTVQDAVFDDVALLFRAMADQYIPVLESGFVKIGTAFNNVFKNIAAFMREAQQVGDITQLFYMFGLTVDKLSPGLENVLAAFIDLSVVGGTFLPGLAQGFTNVTDRFREFIETARGDGSLELWIANGIVALRDFGDLLGNIGGIFGAMFDAGQKAGTSFLDTARMVTAELETFLRTGQGQAGMIALFQGIREAIEAMMPGIRTFLGAVADAFANLQPAFGAVGEAFSSFSAALSPTIPLLASLLQDIIMPLSAAFVWLTDSIGGAIPLVIALAVGFKAFTGVAVAVAAIGRAMAGVATATGLAALAMGASGGAATKLTDNMTKFGNAIQRASAALPLIGAALIAGWAIWDASKSKADEYATAVTRGAKTVEEAIQAEIAQLETRDFWFAQSKEYEAAGDANRRAEATRNVTTALREQLGTMGDLERAQAEVNIAESNYLDIQARFGDAHAETAAALSILQGARQRLTSETERHTRATMTDTEALLENTRVVQEAANADLALERANLRLEEQQQRTTATLREHSATSVEGRRATLDLQQAYLDAATAAGTKAQADAEAREETDAAAQGARAYQERLIELAGTATGPLREALITTIGNLASTKDGSNDAALAAAGLTEEVGRVPTTQTTTYNTPGLDAAVKGVSDLSTGVDGLKNKSFTITATGEVKGVGMTGLATGGILPGYTPGQDIHLAALSGGEAVMRPEWTRAVGADYIYSANAVARAGGIGAVRQWMQEGAPTGARGAGPQQVHEYAVGGVVNRTVTGTVNYTPPPITPAEWYEKVAATFQGNVAKAAAAAAAGAIGGGSGPGGYQWQMNVLRSQFPGLQLISGFRPGSITATGNRSYHAQGRAVDVPPRMDVFNWIKATYGANSKEIIYSPANGGQIWNGRPHMYSEPTRGDHWDHVHWAFDRGGEARGRGWMFKNMIRPERILDPDMTERFNELIKDLRQNRRGGFSQLPYATPVGAISMPTPRNQPTQVKVELTSLLREISDLRRELLSRPQQVITQNIDGSRNPQETGHSAALALKLCR